jgi:hypothetical protein
MCGRVVQKTPLSEIRVFFETVNPVPNAAPTYNGARRPTTCRLSASTGKAVAPSTCSDGA